jgi:hypothetical protein
MKWQKTEVENPVDVVVVVVVVVAVVTVAATKLKAHTMPVPRQVGSL